MTNLVDMCTNTYYSTLPLYLNELALLYTLCACVCVFSAVKCFCYKQ